MTNIEKGNKIIAAYERHEITYKQAHAKIMAIAPLLDLELFAASECRAAKPSYQTRIQAEASRLMDLGQSRPAAIKRILKLNGYNGRSQFGS